MYGCVNGDAISCPNGTSPIRVLCLKYHMFNACDYSFAPKNADEHAKEACIEVLNGNYEQDILSYMNLS